MVVWVVGMVRPARVVRSMAKKSPVTAMFSHQITPFSRRPEIPPRPGVLLSSTQSVWVDFRRAKQKPRKNTPGLGFGLIT